MEDVVVSRGFFRAYFGPGIHMMPTFFSVNFQLEVFELFSFVYCSNW